MKTLTVKLDEMASVNLKAAMKFLGKKTGAGCIRQMILSHKLLMLQNKALEAEVKALKYENEELKAILDSRK